MQTDVPRLEAHFSPSDDQDRTHERFSVELDVTVGSHHNFYVGFAEDLSTGGVFVATHTQKQTGVILDININLAGCERPIKGVGEVRWAREFREGSSVPPGLGVRFVELEDGSEAMIEEFLKSREPLFYDD